MWSDLRPLWADHNIITALFSFGPGGSLVNLALVRKLKIGKYYLLSAISPHGVEAVNRLIQLEYRQKMKDWATSRYRKIPKPMGGKKLYMVTR